MMAARRSYTAGFKLNVVAYAKEMGNRAAGNLFCVNEKQIRYWKKQEDLLRVSHKSKRANRGGSARWSLLEDLLEAWVLEEVAMGQTRLSTRVISQKANAIAREKNIQGFIGGPSWCFRFMRRKKLVFINSRGRKKIVASAQLSSENPDNIEDVDNSMLSNNNRMQNGPETTMGPMELLLPPNIEADAMEQTDFEQNDVEILDEIKEEIQDDQTDCQMAPRMINENSSPDITHQGVDDSVVMETYQPSSKQLLVVPQHQYSMMSSLALMWKNQKMCDASIGNGTIIIRVHKVVLLAISPTLLSSSEVRNNCFLKVNFPANISENAMTAFAEYMYNGVLDLDPLTLTQLQQISYQLGIDELCMLCESHLCSQTTQVPSTSINNLIKQRTSMLPHFPKQSEPSPVQRKHSSGTEVKKRGLQTNLWSQNSDGGQDFVSHGPVAIKTELQNTVQDYCPVNPIVQTHPARTMTKGWPLIDSTLLQGSRSASATKSSKTTKTFQEPNQTVQSQLASHIKTEPIDQSELAYGQHRSSISSDLSTSNCPHTKTDHSSCTTSDFSNTTEEPPENSNYHTKFSRNPPKAVAATAFSSASKLNPSTHCESNLTSLARNNSFNDSIARSKSSMSDPPLPVMLFSSEMETLPLNVSKTTTKQEQYVVDLTS